MADHHTRGERTSPQPRRTLREGTGVHDDVSVATLSQGRIRRSRRGRERRTTNSRGHHFRPELGPEVWARRDVTTPTIISRNSRSEREIRHTHYLFIPKYSRYGLTNRTLISYFTTTGYTIKEDPSANKPLSFWVLI